MSEWFNLDKFWESMADKMFTTEQWENAAAEINAVVVLTNPGPDAAVLDLCCGPGRHSLALAQRGYTVTGVDLTERYLQQARDRTAQAGLDITFIREDMRTYSAPASYNLILNLFTSFGYFQDIADDRKVVARMYENLKPGGKAVIELMGKEVLARIFRPRDWYEQDGVLFLEERTVTRNWSWIENRWIRIEQNDRKEFTLAHRLYSAMELEEMLYSAGFSRVAIFGSLEGTPYDNHAGRLVVIGEK